MDWVPINPADKHIVEHQIARPPRNLHAVASRCWNHSPQVVVNHPLPQSAEDAPFFPTVFWLTCPETVRRISRIEDKGLISRLQAVFKSNEKLKASLKDAHSEYIYIRRSLLGPQKMLELRKGGSSLAGQMEKCGIGGLADFEGVKCLHMHYAHYLVTGNNPIGMLIHELLHTHQGPWQCQGCKQNAARQPDLTKQTYAGVAELADAADLKSAEPKGSCRFETGPRHQPLTPALT